MSVFCMIQTNIRLWDGIEGEMNQTDMFNTELNAVDQQISLSVFSE